MAGGTWVNNQNYNYVTLKYGSTIICLAPPPRLMGQTSENDLQEELYPNPFSYSAIIKLNPETIHNGVLSIYDITGKLVSSVQNINSNTIFLERGDLGKGIYFYKISEDDKNLATGKFIITDE
ncbi:MAG: T9SS type A sorting domain-containing protein [Bacteroidetes bacterium]|nr:T9SS type A sorting domain-containing protein [Bacteroidota bacterium]